MIRILFVSVVLSTTQNMHAQDNPSEVEKLAMTCKVWGFLKYYHPQVATGKYDWDYALIKFLPFVEEAKTWDELNQVAFSSILSLGTVPTCETCDSINPDWFNENFDLRWTDDQRVFSPQLISVLDGLEQNRNQGFNRYARENGVGGINMSGEKNYGGMGFPSNEYRLLELFRYWNAVEYFFPYKYQMDEDWDSTLFLSIPEFEQAYNALTYQLALAGLIAKLNDSHAGLFSPLFFEVIGHYYLPAQVQIIDDKVIVCFLKDTVHTDTNYLRLGDEIVEMNGISMSEKREQLGRYTSGSNNSAKDRNITSLIIFSKKDTAGLKILRDSVALDVTIQCIKYQEMKGPPPSDEAAWNKIDSKIGYVNMGILEKEDVADMMRSFLNLEAIIFDLRNYPNGTLYAIADYLNPERVPFVKILVPDFKYPGRFKWSGLLHCGGSKKKSTGYFEGKIVLLINEQTQSHAEFTAMCLQSYTNCITVGSQTSGADGNVSDLKLLMNLKTSMSGIGIFYPNGAVTQRIGIVPDIVIKPSVDDIKLNRDVVLDSVLKILRNGTKSEIKL
ncbi:MAG: hypothetical protein HYZ14_19240 [Bacteroidetes bacterium]|nr:hypothetical protein [Bacteroidota bacterium]